MSIPVVEILTSNLITSSATIVTVDNVQTITFPLAVSFNKIILKGTSAESLTLKYKATSESSFVTETLTQETCNQDIIFSTSSPLSVTVVELTFSPLENLTIGTVYIVKTLLSLNNVLSRLNCGVYSREGHHYLANGALIKWCDFSKNTVTLTLENLPKTTKQNLVNILSSDTFLTYIFYGSWDSSLIAEYSLTQRPKFTLDRKTELFSSTLDLTEK